MGSEDLAFLSAFETAKLIASGAVLPLDVLDASLRQIRKYDPLLHAFISVEEEQARVDARRLTDELATGRRRGPLHGVTVAVKDVLDVAGMRTTHGTRAHRNDPPARHDADVVRRLREAGVIVLGKTNTPAFAAYAHTTNAIAGTTVSPWDVMLSSGGSSGGSAAAVAAGMCTFALGTDLGGSVRGPSAWAGIFGIRPTAGRVSNDPHGWVDDSIDVVGAMARDVRDLRLWLEAVQVLVPAIGRTLTEDPLRIAYSVDLGGVLALDPDIRAVFANALAAMCQCGCALVEKAPAVRDALNAIRPLRALRALATYDDADLPTIAADNKNLASFVTWAQSLSGRELGEGGRLRTKAWRDNADFFSDIDVFVMPTAQFSGIPHDRGQPYSIDGHPVDDPLSAWHSTYIISVLGWPVVAIPCGWTPAGRPVGLQLIGPRGSDLWLLEVAGRLCARSQWSWRKPPLCDSAAR